MRGPRRRARRRFTWLLVVLVVLGAGYVAADLATRSIAEEQLTHAIRKKTHAGEAVVRVDSIPFLFDLVVSGSVGQIDVGLLDVPAGRLDLARIEVSANNLRIDRHYLFDRRKIRVTAISSAKVQVTVTAGELSRAIGHAVSLSPPNTIRVAIGPVSVPATIAVTSGHFLTFSALGLRTFVIDLTSVAVVPRCTMHLTVRNGSATLACRVSPVPAFVISALSGGS